MRSAPIAVAAASVLGLACPAPPVSTPPLHAVITPPPPPDAARLSTASASATASAAPHGLEPPEPTLRLPRNFTPRHHIVDLDVDPARPTFHGTMMIAGEIGELSSVIWLHGRHLKIVRAAASHGDPFESADASARTLAVTPHGDDLLELRAEVPLEPGVWSLYLEYEGEIDQVNTVGLFGELAGGKRYAFTKLESTFARRVFPCLDEPDNKVPWQLTLDVPQALVAVSNTPIVKETPIGEGKKRVEFAATKPLPSYLVAFGVGPFDVVDAGKTRSGTPIRVLTPAGRGGEAAWSAKTAAPLVDLLEDYFGRPYPYDKLDLLAVPLTVGWGAMENAGLVMTAERLMLGEPVHHSWERRHAWIEVAAHELAHQWFGDLVTTAWWNDIWLNEGFATWMAGKIVARFEPKWHQELAAVEVRNTALAADSMVSARRIRQPIERPADILEAFDGITYQKGASVLAMFESYLGRDVVQRGVRDYLEARAFGNATSADFVAAIGKAAGKDVAPAFASFLEEPGEPELTARLVCDQGAPRVELAQARYVAPGSPAPPAGKPWLLPVCVAYERGGKRAEACTLLDAPTGGLALETRTCPRWLMPNVEGRGYYRTKLSVPQVTALRDEAWPLLSWAERRALMFDLVGLSRSRRGARAQLPALRTPLPIAMSLVPKLLAAGDRYTASDAFSLPESLDRLVPDDQRPKYEAWVRMTFGQGAAKVGVLPKDGDDLDAETLHVELVHVVGWLGRDPDVIAHAVDLARSWRDLPPAIRGEVLTIAVDASPELFDRVIRDVKTEPDQTLRAEALRAVARVRDPARLPAALALLLDPALDIRETQAMLQETSREATRAVAETFFRDHRDQLLARMPRDGGGTSAIAWLFTSACDAARRDDIATYVSSTFGPLPGGRRLVDQATELMDQCIASRTALEPEVRAWLGGGKLLKPKDAKKK